MNKKDIEVIFRWRKTIVNNIEKIIKNSKKSDENDLSSQGQLTLFDAGLEVKKDYKLEIYTGKIDFREFVDLESELLGLPITYDPLDDWRILEDLFCTHNSSELPELDKKTENIVILDRIVSIEYKISEKGNKYCKLFLANFGGNYYLYLWGENFRNHINKVFKNECYLFQVTFNTPTKDFDRYSYVCTYLKNVKDFDIEEEINNLINNSKLVESNFEWQLKNRKK